MAITLEQIRKRVVPDSSKKGSDIDSQYLEPASYDKKVKEKMIGSENADVYDQHDNEAQNFKAQDTVSKNTKAPLREMPEQSVSTSNEHAVNRLYEEESLDLIDDILDMVENDNYGVSDYCWREVSTHLKAARDVLVRHNIQEQQENFIDESFKVGSNKLRDGSTVKLTKEDVKSLNVAISGTANKAKLLDEVTNSKKDFNDFLSFSKNLSEDFDSAIANLLEEADDQQLEYIAANRLSEGDVWNNVKRGAKIGAKVGSVAGAAGGAVYGGAIGGGVGIAAKVTKIVKKRREEQSEKKKEAENVHEDVKSLEGTAAPAMDTTPELEKKDKKKVNEELGANASAKQYIDDFEKSKDSRFKGDSKEKRRQRAIAAYMSSKDKK